MPPKKGKKGKKKGSGTKKGKKSKEPELTPTEAILTYKINLKEDDINELNFQIKELEDMTNRSKERNERLAEERQGYINILMKKIQEIENQNSDKFTDKPVVIATMKENWDLERQEQQAISNIKSDIQQSEKDIVSTKEEIAYWQTFRDQGSVQQKTTIRLLQQEIRDSHETFQSMCDYLDRKQNKDKTFISQVTNMTIEKHKAKATKHAISQLDKNSKQELVDNEWLKSEAEIHRREVDRILSQVEELEKANLQIMSILFECRVQDLTFSHNFFMTQFQDDENLETGGILQIDLDDVLKPKKTDQKKRPKSAVMKAVEDKFLQMTKGLHEESDEDQDLEEDYADVEYKEPWEQCAFSGESRESLMSLGPLEVKMLSVTGSKARLNTPMIPSPEELEAKQWNPDVWPVNAAMLKSVN